MSPAEFLAAHGLQLALGSTVLLGVGCFCMARTSEPGHTRRMGELLAWGVLAFLVLGVLPLPRLSSPDRELPREPTQVSVQEPTAQLLSPVQPISPRDEVSELLEYPGNPAQVPLLSRRPGSALVPGAVGVGTAEGDRVSWFLTLYLLGVGVCTAYFLAGGIHLGLLLRRADPAPRWVLELVAKAESGPMPQVLVGTGRFRPFCIGFPRRMIVLPARLCHPERSGQLRQVLLHELGHFRSGDGRSQVPFILLLPFLFFHPLFWWLRARVRLASEVLADDWAARHSTKIHYARELIALAEDDAKHRLTPLGASCIFRSPSEFYRRIKMLLERDGHLSTHCSLPRRVAQTTAATVLVGITVCLWGAPPVAAQRPGQSGLQPGMSQGETLESLRKERDALRDRVVELERRMAPLLFRMGGVPGVDEAARPPGVVGAVVPGWGPGTGPGVVVRTGPDEAARPAGVVGAPVGPDGWPRWMPGVPGATGPGEAPATRGRRRIVVVEVGDTFQSLVRQHMGGVAGGDEVLSLNPSVDPHRLRVGQELVFPPIDPPSEPAIPGPSTFLDPFTEVPPAPVPAPATQVSGQPQGSILNSATLQLVIQAIEMGADLETAEEELAHQEELAEVGVVDSRTVNQTRRNVITAKRKVELFSSLIKAEIEAAAEELELFHYRAVDYAKESLRHRELQAQMRRAEHRIQILQSVL